MARTRRPVMKVCLTLLIVAAIGGTGYGYYRYRTVTPAPAVTTAPVTRGEIVDEVRATGTLQAVTTVQVGTQVSGTIQELTADFNALVKKGRVLARLDPSLFQTQVEQARANLVRAQADVERLKVAAEDARTKLERARELYGRQLLPKSDLDAADTTLRAADAQVRSAEAQVTQAQASLNQSDVNLQHTVIAAPIDGLVISRNVDVGQTVAASMQAPTLYILAADLTRMQVVANLDESDVGRIRPGQHVTFRVDAYPADTFTGTVAQVRLQPIVQQNVVTYATVINVPNGDLRLRPGMTANVNVEIARRSNVLRLPNTALRFRPSDDVFAALGQTPLAPQGTRAAYGPGRGGTAGTRSVDRTMARPDASVRASRANATGEHVNQAPRRLAQSPHAGRVESVPQHASATTIDALFGPPPPVESVGRVWVYADHQLKPVPVRLGISDGQVTELVDGDGLEDGTGVVTNVSTTRETTRPATTSAFPGFLGQPPQRFGGPGGGFGTGGNRGR